jgi:hypothetical protein
MLEAAKVLSVLAVILGLASLSPRLRIAMKASWACIGAVALCLLGAAV